RIILFRHGPAERRDDPRWPDDLTRPLTARGAARTRRSARGVARHEPRADRVFTSPALRALESAQLLAAALGVAGPEPLASLAPGGAWRETFQRLSREPADATLALVGHEPELGVLAAPLPLSAEADPRPVTKP